jgi:hypothetical protein
MSRLQPVQPANLQACINFMYEEKDESEMQPNHFTDVYRRSSLRQLPMDSTHSSVCVHICASAYRHDARHPKQRKKTTGYSVLLPLHNYQSATCTYVRVRFIYQTCSTAVSQRPNLSRAPIRFVSHPSPNTGSAALRASPFFV